MRLLFLILVIVTAVHASPPILISAPGEWVKRSAEPKVVPTPAEDLTYGYDYLLLETQVNVEERSGYHRNVYRITSESSLQSGARLTLEFDPAFETLTVHHVRVIRDGVMEERLREGLFSTIQQERDLDRHLLNGELTGLAVLDDIRVGDIVDYAFTRRGWNPAFGDRYVGGVSTGWSVPVRHQIFQVTAPASRTIRFQAHGTVPLSLVDQRQGPDRVLTWEGFALRPIETESELPSWFTPYPSIRLSEFEDWAAVVKWAEPLYALPAAPSLALVEKAQELTHGLDDDSARTVAILQFVQQEVRYLGMELGAGSYRPTDPAVVLARRFGDCKDKSLLFCALMHAAGLRAFPAFLSTDWRTKIEDWLASPYAFDHVIACVPSAAGNQFVDPTLRYQQGDLSRRGLPDYGRVLLVKAGETASTKVVIPPLAQSTVHIEEQFDIKAFDQPARFRVSTRSSGLNADSQRRYFAQTTPDQIAKYYVNYYATNYPGLTSVAPPTLTDDRTANEVTVTETYDVPNLWVDASEPRKIKAQFYPKTISDYAVRPQTSIRSMPLRIAHPIHVWQSTTVNLPEDWTVKPAEIETESFAFRAKDGISGNGRVVKMNYEWETLTDHVPADKVEQHVKQLNQYRDGLGYSLSYTKPEPASKVAASPVSPTRFELNWKLVLVAIIVFAVAGYAGRWLWHRGSDSPPLLIPGDPRLAGIGGWLLLVAFGVTLRPLSILYELLTTLRHTFDQNVWEAVTTPGTAAYQKWLGPLIVSETIGNTVLLAGGLILIALFYAKKRTFPTAFTFMAMFSVAFAGLDAIGAGALLVHATTDLAQTYKAVIQAIGQAIIWIPYMQVSRRVKATFVR
ncbi:MAG: DUF3857 domain-containing protein [Opitutus sp.]